MNDDEMDLALREYGDRWRAAQSAPPAVPELRRGPRWPVAAGVAASVLAIIGVGMALTRTDGKGQGPTPPFATVTSAPQLPLEWTRVGVVPWQPDPAPRDEPSPPVEGKGKPESAPPCADGAIEMVARFAPPAGRGPVAGVLEIRNTGEAICRVQSKFTWFPVGVKEPEGLGITSELGPAAVMAPGDLAFSSLTWWGQECSRTSELDRIRLVPHTNDGLAERVVPAVGLSRGACERPYGDAGSGSWAVAVTRRPELDVARLAASIDAPATVRAGELVRFAVTLTNTTDEPVRFLRGERECPVVVFSLGVNYERHRLRCLHVPNDQLRRGEAIRFEFELVAAGNGDGGKVPGSSALEWRFDAVPFGGPGGASVPVTVTD